MKLIATGDMLRTLDGKVEGISALAISSDGKLLASATGTPAPRNLAKCNDEIAQARDFSRPHA